MRETLRNAAAAFVFGVVVVGSYLAGASNGLPVIILGAIVGGIGLLFMTISALVGEI